MLAIAHVCMACGIDLARVRGAFDPRFRLPVVVCPRCRRAVVRRRRTVPLVARLARRLVTAGATLAVQAVLILFLTAMVCGSILALDNALIYRSTDFFTKERPGELIGLAISSLLAGIWLTAGLGHLSRRKAWTAWMLWLVFWLIVVSAVIAVLDVVVSRPEALWLVHPPIDPPSVLLSHWAIRGALIVPSLIFGIAGRPLGRVILRGNERRRSLRWRRRRRRLRRRRNLR
jgi:hypothetical protein